MNDSDKTIADLVTDGCNMGVKSLRKSYHKPESNAALLSGILFCGNRGGYMRPKLSQRKNAAGEYTYSYLFQLKEKSHLYNCKMKNSIGDTLDQAVCEEVKKLTADNLRFLEEISNTKKEFTLKTEGYETELSKISQALSSVEKGIANFGI